MAVFPPIFYPPNMVSFRQKLIILPGLLPAVALKPVSHPLFSSAPENQISGFALLYWVDMSVSWDHLLSI